MKSIITKFLMSITIMLLTCIPAYPFDFEVDGVFYTIISDTEGTCEVSKGYGDYTGEVEIPSTVTFESRQFLVSKIAYNAFSGCSSLTSVTLPKSILDILGEYFAGCSSLSKISVTQDNPNYCSMDGVLFNKDCTVIIAYPNAKGNEYIIPESVTSIATGAFMYCDNLTSITIPDSVTTIGWHAFYSCNSLVTVIFGNSVTYITESAFAKCNSIMSLTIPDSVKVIGREAFESCTSLLDVTIGNSVTQIGFGAFSNCSSLSSVTIGNSLSVIGNSAFYDCSCLTTINIPNSVIEIGDSAFTACCSLASISIPNSVTKIGINVFSYCISLEEIVVAQDNPNFCSIDGVLFSKDCNTLIAYPNAKGTEYIIPNSVTAIGMDAFCYCVALSCITIPDSVTEVQAGAFLCCSSLTSLTLSGKITKMGELSFAECENLTSVYYNCLDPIEIEDIPIFAGSLDKASLYVPDSAVEKCLITSPWKYFNNIKAYEFARVETINGLVPKVATGIFDVSGSPVVENHQGMIIIQYSDGSTKKILQK